MAHIFFSLATLSNNSRFSFFVLSGFNLRNFTIFTKSLLDKLFKQKSISHLLSCAERLYAKIILPLSSSLYVIIPHCEGMYDCTVSAFCIGTII